MICEIGVDLVDIARVKKLIQTYPDQLDRIFTRSELKSGKKDPARLAEFFAGKEAVLKVLGTGWRNGLNWTDVDVATNQAKLKGMAKKISNQMKINKILVATSATKKKAVAQAIGVGS